MDDGSADKAGDAVSQLQEQGDAGAVCAVNDYWLRWRRGHVGVLACRELSAGAALGGRSPVMR